VVIFELFVSDVARNKLKKYRSDNGMPATIRQYMIAILKAPFNDVVLFRPFYLTRGLIDLSEFLETAPLQAVSREMRFCCQSTLYGRHFTPLESQ